VGDGAGDKQGEPREGGKRGGGKRGARRVDAAALVLAAIHAGTRLRQSLAAALLPLGLTPEQHELLELVAAGHTTPSAVVAASGRDKTTLSRTIARAARAGFLEPARRDDDRRRHDLLLTSAGQAALQHSRRTLERTAPKLLETLSAKQQRRLGKALRKMGG
jgi:DNA-binding MarR family transcriptional regulator